MKVKVFIEKGEVIPHFEKYDIIQQNKSGKLELYLPRPEHSVEFK